MTLIQTVDPGKIWVPIDTTILFNHLKYLLSQNESSIKRVYIN